MKKLILCALFLIVSLSLFAEDNYDRLFNYHWWLETEYDINEPPEVIFRKLEIPPGNITYQRRLRRERFTLVYHQAEEKDKYSILKETLYKDIYNVKFNENYTTLILEKGGIIYGRQNRVGQQVNRNYPLVGVWGSLPHLTEYRIVDPKECLIYMEIVEQYPHWAVRAGTYLLKQIDENTFETVSSFPDGCLRLEVKNEKRITLVPLFTLPDDEQGRVSPMLINRWP